MIRQSSRSLAPSLAIHATITHLSRPFLLPTFSFSHYIDQATHIKFPSFPIVPQVKLLSTTSSKMSGSKAFFDTIKNRRTIYAIANESPIPDSQIQEIVTEAIRHVPSSFNSQSARAVLVLNKEHGKLWDTIIDIYEKILPADQFKQYKPKFDGFRGGYGTVSLSLIIQAIPRKPKVLIK